MENGKTYGKQTPEEIARAAQEAAIKSAMEQAQLMLGNIPGMNMQDMQAQIMAQMQWLCSDPRGRTAGDPKRNQTLRR